MSNNILKAIYKKIKYLIFDGPVLIRTVSNWYVLPKLFFNSKDMIVKLRNGIKFRVTHYLDVLTVKEIFIDNDYKLKSGGFKTIIDIGANIGTFVVLSSIKNPGSTIYAYEPAKRTFNILNSNLNRNNIKRVKTFREGVAGKKGKRTLYIQFASGLSSVASLQRGVKREIIRVTTLADIFDKNKLERCDLLKIDCEGAEYEIFSSTPQKIFAKIRSLIVEYHDGSLGNHTTLVSILRKNGFRIRVKRHKIEKDIGILYAQK